MAGLIPSAATLTDLAARAAGRCRRWAHAGIDRLPRQCELCRQWSEQPVCTGCWARFAPPVARCPRCAIAMADGRTCGPCLRQPPPFTHAIAAVDYGYPWDALVARFKFHARPELATCLARRLAECIALSGATTVDCVLPVPLSMQRLRERGYNQAWELARRIGGQLQIATDARALVRGRDTVHQVGLGRAARASNLRHGLWTDPRAAARIQGRRLALVDDVMTTGATADAAAQALLRGGAAQVQLWVLARTPSQD